MPVAVARFSESTSAHVGMRTQTSAIACAAAVRPGPSLPISSAIRCRPSTSSGCAGLADWRARRRAYVGRSIASPRGVNATIVNPAFRRAPRSLRPVPHARVRRAQHAPHRRSNRFAVQRVAARFAQEHTRAEGRGIAERAADVVWIGNPFEYEQKIRPGAQHRQASERSGAPPAPDSRGAG